MNLDVVRKLMLTGNYVLVMGDAECVVDVLMKSTECIPVDDLIPAFMVRKTGKIRKLLKLDNDGLNRLLVITARDIGGVCINLMQSMKRYKLKETVEEIINALNKADREVRKVIKDALR